MISPQSGALVSLSPSKWDFWPCLPHADADNQSGELLKSFFVNIISKLRPLLSDFNKVVVSQINKHTIFQSLVWRPAESRKGIRICYSLSSKLLFHFYHLWIVFSATEETTCEFKPLKFYETKMGRGPRGKFLLWPPFPPPSWGSFLIKLAFLAPPTAFSHYFGQI